MGMTLRSMVVGVISGQTLTIKKGAGAETRGTTA
eukprot:CAMPEP_0202418310 /NCGR_PEP_ID=MMETSP1128-20130828/45904_1 /ASSEMBLY_ACC=CAM_ASM_000463 /TAXON_ID=3047 /ORGANISM="Dunaliella tertiolecta, Strain CCMP1320" /LENGTH=33 /DNA_ID= /DNA_START= /DNA_END= /DNA_ORIENTATION=